MADTFPRPFEPPLAHRRIKHTISIIIPVYGRAGVTRRCLEGLFALQPEAEVIVVDDASPDATPQMLESYVDRAKVIFRSKNGGFATACNEGAAAASGQYLVFLNSDTVPLEGWLEALADHADRNPEAAVVGSKLLYPNGSVQHAGVVICQDGYPRNLYAGFPADHPAVEKTRGFQAVTGASMLVRRHDFRAMGGFDSGYRNCLEDVDLCLRLREQGRQVHYCHRSVLYHLESVSRGTRAKDFDRSVARYRQRWMGQVRPDDLDYYQEDGLVRIAYQDTYPVRLNVSSQLAELDGDRRNQTERVLGLRSRQVTELIHEVARLSVLVADAELGREESRVRRAPVAGQGQEDFWELADRIELELHELQTLASLFDDSSEPSPYLDYRRLQADLRRMASESIPSGGVVAVVSRGDERLLEFEDRVAWHFPQTEAGTYIGHHPADDAEAITQLEEVRRKGAQFLLLPATASWWLDHYRKFSRHLELRYSMVAEEKQTGLIFHLGSGELHDS